MQGLKVRQGIDEEMLFSSYLYVSPFQGLRYINTITQDFVLLRPELLHDRALPFRSYSTTFRMFLVRGDTNQGLGE